MLQQGVQLKGGIEFTIVWSDQDVIKSRVSCSNGRFSGETNIYLGHDALPKMIEALSGFPFDAADSRTLEFGAFNPQHAGGGIRMHFFCRDSVGHAAVDVALREDACIGLGEVESVALRLNVEAAAVDSFLMQVRNMDPKEIGATACLDLAS